MNFFKAGLWGGLFLVISWSDVRAQTASPSAEVREVVKVEEGETVNQDFWIAGGDTVEIMGTVNGEVWAAGGRVIIRGTVNGDVIVAGGRVTMTGTVSEDMRVAGGEVRIGGTIGQELTVMGGDVLVEREAEIAGGAVLVGGMIAIEGQVVGRTLIAGGEVDMEGEINNNLEIYTANLRIGPQARVAGDLIYPEQIEVQVSDEAVIEGQIIERPVTDQGQMDIARDITAAWFGLRVMMGIAGVITMLVLGFFLIRFFPVTMKAAAVVIDRQFWASLGVGLVTMIVVPVAIMVLLITFFGIPLALLAGLIFWLYLYLAKAYVAYWLGLKIMGLTNKDKNSYWAYILGLLILYLIFTFLPFIGGLVYLVVLIVGLGAALLRDRNLYLEAGKKGLV